MFVIRFLRDWTLPCAMAFGLAVYFIFHCIDALAPLRPAAVAFGTSSIPVCVFLMLFFTFNKVDLSHLRPRRWHVELQVLQTVICGLLAWAAMWLPGGSGWKIVVEGALACALCPTATAAAVITGELGGSSAAISSYTLLSNLWSALLITLLCPLVELHANLGLAAMMGRMFGQVAELLLLPFVVAMLVRRFWPWLHERCLRLKGISFYIWAFVLAVVTAQTARIVASEGSHPLLEVGLACAGLVMCTIHFVLGKTIGGLSGDRVSGGQAFGQKNTSFAIWMAFAFLNPLSAISPGTYVLWQNSFNSWQLWRRRRRERLGLPLPRDRSAADDE